MPYLRFELRRNFVASLAGERVTEFVWFEHLGN